jgi:hypothetical protein
MLTFNVPTPGRIVLVPALSDFGHKRDTRYVVEGYDISVHTEGYTVTMYIRPETGGTDKPLIQLNPDMWDYQEIEA